MEVINGNQAESGQKRRRDDAKEPDQRALNWFTRDGDIALLPHSPLALADVLNNTNGCFDLVAVSNADTSDADHHVEDNILNAPTSLQQRRRRKNPRNRANILTQLTQDELLASCKRVQVENALVKRIGIRRLYLTAGFLCWKDESNNNMTHRAPLLFYPVTLVRKVNSADSSEPTLSANTAVCQHASDDENIEYEIRIDSNEPETNALLLEWSRHASDIQLPEYSSKTPMQDYFAQLAQAISGHDNIELQFEVALGNAAPPSKQQYKNSSSEHLPTLPPKFDTALAMLVTKDKSIRQLHSILHLLNDTQPASTGEQDLSNSATDTTGAVSNLHAYSKKLASEGLSSVEFQHLADLPENIAQWVSNVNKALKSNIVCDVLESPALNSRHLIRLAGLIEHIDQAPINIEQFKHADLCYAATPGLLHRAKHQANLIEDELSSLKNTFNLDRVPAKKQLLSLISELGGSLNEGPDIVDADYFNARRQFMEFSIEKPTNLTQEHRSLLGKLAKALRFRELFVNNIEYRLALGPGYRGLRTDWDSLTEAVDYAQEISELLESESLAATALNHWDAFRTAYIGELDVLLSAAESLRKLLWICGSDWQAKPATEVLEQAKQISTKLSTWSDIYGDINTSKTNTPAKVLEQFSGRSQDDVLTELSVGDTQSKIETYVQNSGVSQEALNQTMEWLLKATQSAFENDLGASAIVEHLQIS